MTTTDLHTKPQSETIVLAAPMSLHGSAARIWKLTHNHESWALAGFVTLALVLITLAWTLVLAWYLVFGLLLVPYRLLRHGQRRRNLEEARHRELLENRQR